ncbi:MAG: hypothetical protein ACFNP5_08500 [Hoylesella saccharolytica]
MKILPKTVNRLPHLQPRKTASRLLFKMPITFIGNAEWVSYAAVSQQSYILLVSNRLQLIFGKAVNCRPSNGSLHAV